MAAKLKFLVIYFLSWIIFFDLMRVLFLLYHSDKTSKLPGGVIGKTFWYGLRMDLSVAAYILAPVAFFVILSLFVPFFRRLTIYKIYTFIILLLVSVICLSDLELYNAWGFRIDSTPLKFMTSPKEALASMSHLPLLWILFFFIVCFSVFYYFFTVIMKRSFFGHQARMKGMTAVVLIVFLGALMIPVRGGFQQSPLNQSSVYFSTIPFANHSAINASWNFIHSVFGKDMFTKNPYEYLSPAREQEVLNDIYGYDSTGLDSIRYKDRYQEQALKHEQWIVDDAGKKVNVIVVMWESFTEKAIHLSLGGQAITPRFNEYRRDGIFFTNCFATGDRTNKGVPAVFSGYPAMPNTTIIHSPNKSAKLNALPQLFRAMGYNAPFFYGGETEFANIKSYLIHAGFDPIVGKGDFAATDMNSKWGAHDGVVMKRVLADLAKTPEPFFAGWLTLSSHEPFEVPVPTVIPGKEVPKLFLNSLHYTDQVLGEFIDSCKKQSWWDHTVIIIIGDHGHPLPETGKRSDDFRTPMLWTGGAINQKGLIINRPVSQIDIANTLMRQVHGFPPAKPEALFGMDSASLAFTASIVKRAPGSAVFPFSRDMANPREKNWAFFSFNNGFGYVDTSGILVFDNVGKQLIMQDENSGAAQLEDGKALMHFYFEDFLRK